MINYKVQEFWFTGHWNVEPPMAEKELEAPGTSKPDTVEGLAGESCWQQECWSRSPGAGALEQECGPAPPGSWQVERSRSTESWWFLV